MILDWCCELGKRVELRRFELRTSCMPCLAVPSATVALSLIPAGQAGPGCLATSGPVCCCLSPLSLG